MKTKIRDILIISAILLGLVGLAFVFGCKDKAEARDKGWRIEDGVLVVYKDEVTITGQAFRAIYDRELTADEIARIYEDPFYEPNEIIKIPKQKYHRISVTLPLLHRHGHLEALRASI